MQNGRQRRSFGMEESMGRVDECAPECVGACGEPLQVRRLHLRNELVART